MNEENKFSTEFCKYVFSDEEKRDIATNMAQSITNLQQTEDDKKAIMSDYKSQIDALQAAINNAATKINNGYETRTIKCEVIPDWEEKIWEYRREDNGLIEKTRKMTADDLQKKIC